MGTGRIEVHELAKAFAKTSIEGETDQRIALHLYRRLALGRPVPLAEVARHAGLPPEHVEARIGSWPAVFRDARGRVVGFWGLTLKELTPTHRFRIDGRTLFTWCAWDTLFLPELLGGTAEVESTCPMTGETISLVVGPKTLEEISHPEAVVSFLVPERHLGDDVITTFCHFVHFFASDDASRTWIDDHEGTFLLSVGEAYLLGREVNRRTFGEALGTGR